MKYWLFLIMIFIAASFNKISYADNAVELVFQGKLPSKQDPFYFLNPVPASVKLFDKINLSFFRNKLLVLQYRYRLQTPYGSQTEIDGRFIIWSAWIKDDLTEIKIPRLDQEGGYKLIIEYKPQIGNETKKYEKVFYVYYVNPLASVEAAKSKTQPQANRTDPGTTSAGNRTTTGTPAGTSTERTVTTQARTTAAPSGKTPPGTNTIPPDKSISRTGSGSADAENTKISARAVRAPENIAGENNRIYDKRLDLRGVKIKTNILPEVVPRAERLNAEPSEKKILAEKSSSAEYDLILAEAMEKKDSALFREAIQNGAGTLLKGKTGGNIFHLMNGAFAGENLISMLKNKGFSINEPDDNGNSPLHIAIISRDNQYVHSLINQGADLNTRNKLELSPLHLAVLLNDAVTADELIKKGALIDLKGNTGYTPLHIASELNNIEIANNLLLNGARNRIRTRQGLSPVTIARIQNYEEMVGLITKKKSVTVSPTEAISPGSFIKVSPGQIPVMDFNLPYDKNLSKKRQFNKIVQIISIPAFAISTSYAVYLKTQANHNYSLSRVAESEEIAKYYYDKTVRFDTFAYISGGISLVSAYGVIHSTLRKLNLSRRMVKKFY